MASAERPDTLTRRFVVRGRVQGVGFRCFVEAHARALGIVGWVCNRYDGSVEVLANGTPQQLRELQERLREGPRAARVDEVEVSEADPVERLQSFYVDGAWCR